MLNLSNSNLGQLLHFRQKHWKIRKEGMWTCNFMAKCYPILDSIDTPDCFLLWKPELNDGLGEHAAQGMGNAYTYCEPLSYKRNQQPRVETPTKKRQQYLYFIPK